MFAEYWPLGEIQDALAANYGATVSLTALGRVRHKHWEAQRARVEQMGARFREWTKAREEEWGAAASCAVTPYPHDKQNGGIAHGTPQSPAGREVTPQPASSLGHLLPKGEGKYFRVRARAASA